MDDQYKVEFLSTIDVSAKFKLNMPVDELDLKYRLEALLVERFKEGFKFVQMVESQRMNPMNGKNMSGLIIVFEKMEEKDV